MMRFRIPKGDDWRDHAEPCPNCKKPVLSHKDHYVAATMTDPAWYDCDPPSDDDDAGMR